MIERKYAPVVEINADITTGLIDAKIGMRIEVILNYRVIEQTKSYTVMQIKSAYRRPSKRI